MRDNDVLPVAFTLGAGAALCSCFVAVVLVAATAANFHILVRNAEERDEYHWVSEDRTISTGLDIQLLLPDEW